jgi:hypothetical protein
MLTVPVILVIYQQVHVVAMMTPPFARLKQRLTVIHIMEHTKVMELIAVLTRVIMLHVVKELPVQT